MKISIRALCGEDWPLVSKIYLEGIKTGKATFQTDCPTYEDWDKSHIKSCRLVALIDDTVAGWAALSPVSSRCVYNGVAEVSIYIGEGYRGKGVGKLLLSSLIAASEQAGFWTLQSGIMQDNEASIHLHEQCGFRMVGYRERIGKDRLGVWRNNVLMERRAIADEVGGVSTCCQK